MSEQFDTVIIGAGQAGLAVSYYLTQQKRHHVILEKQRIGEAWRSTKWDSFTLVTPNWTLQLPGFAYNHDNPDGFLSGAEVVSYLEDYANSFNPPIRTGIEVTCIEGTPSGFTIETNTGSLSAANVVVATGAFHTPKVPMMSSKIAPHIVQVHSSQYRNPQHLPDGAVLVVGSGQSGCQIAEELYQQGRKVYLATSRVGRMPRRYRGKDLFAWGHQMGAFDRTVDKLESPQERFAPNPQLTGKDGGHHLNLHQFALDGVTLLGHLEDASDSKLCIAPNLLDNLTAADTFPNRFKAGVDNFIKQTGLDAPQDNETELQAGYESEIITELDMTATGITAVIWATGYNFDFRWLKFPIFDEVGYPLHQRGITQQPGLYFVGLQWLHKPKSSLFLGIADDAAHVADHIATRA